MHSHSLLPSLDPLLGCPHRPLLLRKLNAQIFSFPVPYQNLHFPQMHFRLQSSHSVNQETKAQQGKMNCPSPSDLLAGLAEMETSLLTLKSIARSFTLCCPSCFSAPPSLWLLLKIGKDWPLVLREHLSLCNSHQCSNSQEQILRELAFVPLLAIVWSVSS